MPKGKFPCWLKLVRRGNEFSGYESLDGETWWLTWPKFDAKEMLAQIGRRGHLSLEVHSNGPGDLLGKDRWAPGAVCRWRNIFIKEL